MMEVFPNIVVLVVVIVVVVVVMLLLCCCCCCTAATLRIMDTGGNDGNHILEKEDECRNRLRTIIMLGFVVEVVSVSKLHPPPGPQHQEDAGACVSGVRALLHLPHRPHQARLGQGHRGRCHPP